MAILAMSLTNGTATVVVNNGANINTVSIRNDDARWAPIMDAYKGGDESRIERLLSLSSVIEEYSNGNLTVTAAGVFYKNRVLHTLDAQRIMAFVKEKVPFERYANFVSRKMANPSARAIEEMYKFLENENMPLTARGTFIAYKGVQNDYYSKNGNLNTIVIQGIVNEQGQILNRPGETIEIERSSCDDNYKNGCSFGLHAGSLEYARGFAEKIVLVEIDPADVVSVPDEGTFHKLRCCKYIVVGEYTGPLPSNYTNEFSSEPDDECTCGGTDCPDCGCECNDCSGEPDNPTSINEAITNINESECGDTESELEKVSLECGVIENDSMPSLKSDNKVSSEQLERDGHWRIGYNDGFREVNYPIYLPGDENGADSENHRLYITGYLKGYAVKHLPIKKEG